MLTREAIARAVLTVGFSDLTFAAVRDQLGVGHTTLYRHVTDRDELVRIGLSHIFEHATWPSLDGHWREVLSDYALTFWHLLAANPGSATETARGLVPPLMMCLTDDLCAALLRQGFTPPNAILAADIVFDMVTDNRRGVEHVHSARSDTGGSNTRGVDVRSPNQVESPSARPATEQEHQAIHTAMSDAMTSDPLDWFARKLHVALDGVERSLAPSEG
ncbi:TetR/AcrR family transcriptional regulator [Microbacterium sp.]|uniref:TetR/AcrR family transcriptional regulator n=1 Tax=Microbacterium sp. TaxID=51671 RepID=UPI003A85A136